VGGPVTWSTDASQSSAGHPGFHVAPEATLFHRLVHAGMKIAPKHQQNSCHEKDRRQQNGKSYSHPANMPSVSRIFQPELHHNEAGALTNFVEEIQSDLPDETEQE
jgi:hypothetical protein